MKSNSIKLIFTMSIILLFGRVHGISQSQTVQPYNYKMDIDDVKYTQYCESNISWNITQNDNDRININENSNINDLILQLMKYEDNKERNINENILNTNSCINSFTSPTINNQAVTLNTNIKKIITDTFHNNNNIVEYTLPPNFYEIDLVKIDCSNIINEINCCIVSTENKTCCSWLYNLCNKIKSYIPWYKTNEKLKIE